MKYKKLRYVASLTLAMAMLIVSVAFVPRAVAQNKYKTLYRFLGGTDGTQPRAALSLDTAGNLYGTVYLDDVYGWGGALMLTLNADGTWTKTELHSFNDADGRQPWAGLTFDQSGSLYGAAEWGGDYDRGAVFKLTKNAGGDWTESVLYSFTHYLSGQLDGGWPMGTLVFDRSGNLFGTTEWGGGITSCNNGNGCGSVFELAQNPDGSWTEHIVHDFCSVTSCRDGFRPYGGLIFDQAGNLYGTTVSGGSGRSYGCPPDNCGTVFRLTPDPDGSWTETVLHSFCSFAKCGDGKNPWAGLIFDSMGNLYGSTTSGGFYDSGVVFKLTPSPDGTWMEKVLYHFRGGKDGRTPHAELILDKSGNLYGTAEAGGVYGYGVVFKLTAGSDGTWTERVLHSFEDRPGAVPFTGLVLDGAGNLYGTTLGDGTTTFGSVFEITSSKPER
jgi:uncharacterized repeat protein (TIGR03803 family)